MSLVSKVCTAVVKRQQTRDIVQHEQYSVTAIFNIKDYPGSHVVTVAVTGWLLPCSFRATKLTVYSSPGLRSVWWKEVIVLGSWAVIPPSLSWNRAMQWKHQSPFSWTHNRMHTPRSRCKKPCNKNEQISFQDTIWQSASFMSTYSHNDTFVHILDINFPLAIFPIW